MFLSPGMNTRIIIAVMQNCFQLCDMKPYYNYFKTSIPFYYGLLIILCFDTLETHKKLTL